MKDRLNVDNQALGYTDFLSWSPDGKFIAVENDVGNEWS